MTKAQEKDLTQTDNKALDTPEEINQRLSNTEDYIKNNKNIVAYIGAAIVLIAGAIFFYINYQSQQNEEAQKDMFQAVYYFEADSLKKALNGDGSNPGFLTIIDDYSGTDAANLAHFYAGTIYLNQAKYQEAIDHLQDFSSKDILIQARAYALIGDAYMEMKNFAEAEGYYKKAADYKPNKYFTPSYLMKLAIAQEKQNNYKAAAETYSLIVNKYFESTEASDAKKYKAKADELAQ